MPKKTKKKPAKKKAVKRPAKKAVRRPAKKVALKKPKPAVLPKPIGRVTHFYTALKVMIAKFLKPVRVGVSIHIKGATTDFTQKIDSMQYDHKPMKTAPKGKLVGIKVKKRVREGDRIYPAK